MEKLNYKLMNPDGQFNLNLNYDKKGIPLEHEDTKELSTEYDLEAEEEDKKNKEKINKLNEEIEEGYINETTDDLYGRYNRNAKDAKNIKNDLIRFNKEGGKTWDLNK